MLVTLVVEGLSDIPIARRAALTSTLVQGCKLAEVEPLRYFKANPAPSTAHALSRVQSDAYVPRSSQPDQHLLAFPDPNPRRLVDERPVVIGDADPIGAGRENR